MNAANEEANKQTADNDGVCGLCGDPTIRDEGGTAYIICQPCYSRFISVSTVYKRQLDELPFGVIELDSHATVLAFNRTEAQLAQLNAEQVIGRNFFTEVAPCTAVKEFEGRFREFIVGDEQMMQFNFTFSFKHGPVEVEIFFLRVEAGGDLEQGERRARIVVKRAGK